MEAGFGHIQEDAFGPCRRNDAVIEGKRGRGDNDLVPGVQDPRQGGIQSLGRSHGNQNLSGLCPAAPAGLEGSNGPAQTLGALVGGIVGLPRLHSPGGGFTDFFGGVQVRLPDGQHSAIGSLPGQIGKYPDAAALEPLQVVIHGHHRKVSASSSKN